MFTPPPNERNVSDYYYYRGSAHAGRMLSILRQCKYKWIRSGKTSGEGKDEYFAGCGAKHEENSKLKDQVRVHPLYREYPARGANIIGVREGHFENLAMYCGMAYNKKGDVKPMCSNGLVDSLFVWIEPTMRGLKKKSRSLQKL